MTWNDIYRHRSKINNLITRYEAHKGQHRLMSDLSRYLCVVISGYLEQSIKHIFREFTKNNADPRITRYANINIKSFQSADTDSILKLTEKFSIAWANSLRTWMTLEIEASVNGIVNTRHQIAHGVDAGITFGNVKKYYININKLIDYLWNLVN